MIANLMILHWLMHSFLTKFSLYSGYINVVVDNYIEWIWCIWTFRIFKFWIHSTTTTTRKYPGIFFLKHIKVLFKFFLMHSNNGRINFLMSDFFSDWNNNNCVNDIIVQYIRFVEFLPYNEILNEYFLIRFW